MIKPLCKFFLLFLFLSSPTVSFADGMPTKHQQTQELSPPAFLSMHPGFEPCGNEIAFFVGNDNEVQTTEIWRSRDPDSGFELIDVVDGSGGYLDDSLASRKNYYYKLRAVTETDTSEFSRTVMFTSGAEWFAPTLELTLLPDNTVEGRLTDHSYLDRLYDIFSLGARESFHTFSDMLDSGRVFTFRDTTVVPGVTYTYHVDAYLTCEANMFSRVTSASITIPRDGDIDIAAPTFDFDDRSTQACGNEIVISFDNTNEGAITEIWRSLSPESGFELVTVTQGVDVFIDINLASQKTYYYKLRAVVGNSVSEFSDVAGFESGPAWFDPLLELTLLPDNTVQGQLTDRSYLDYSYQISYQELGGAANSLHNNVLLSDSGEVFTFTHASVEPGKTYSYSVDALLGRACGSRLFSNVATDTITIHPSAGEELSSPHFGGAPPGFEPCGNEIVFFVRNNNAQAATEIWRSREPDSGFELIDVVQGSGGYFDDSLASRKDYYYKLRAVTQTDTSEFSAASKYTSGAQWFAPTLQVRLLPDNTVEGTLTDRSYLDRSYDIFATGVRFPFHTFATMADSGRVFTFRDTTVVPGITYTYYVDAYLTCEANMFSRVTSASITIPGDSTDFEIAVPTFDFDDHSTQACGNEIVISFDNPNEGAITEIWRSLSPESGFELVTITQGADMFIDINRASRKTYYYKLRAVVGNSVSEFSDVAGFESGPAWFDPLLELTLTADNTVEGLLADRSYLDYSYQIAYQELGGAANTLYNNVLLPDSGEVFTFTHAGVEPGKTYVYTVDALLGRACGSRLLSNVAIDTISIPDDSGEQLVPPQFVAEHPGYEPCGNQIAFLTENPNEGASTEIWRSRYRDSGFELIAVQGGGYLDDNLESKKAYYYKLRAVKGTDKSEFSEVVAFQSGAKWFEPTLELTLLPDNTVQGTLTDRSFLDVGYEVWWGSSPDGFFVTSNMSDSGRVFTFIDSTVVAGETYTYSVNAILVMTCDSRVLYSVADSTITIPGTASLSLGDQSASVTVFPNPVVADSHINISGAANDAASISLTDSQGRMLFTTHEVLPASGMLMKQIDLDKLRGGIYYLKVDLGDKRVTRRIIVE